MREAWRKVISGLLFIMAVMSLALPVYSQDPGAVPKPTSSDEVTPGFPGEKIVSGGDAMNAGELLARLTEKLGGRDAFERIKDLRFKFRQKYYLEGALRFIEEANCLIRFGDHIKARMDYTNYPLGPSDLETMIDYREVVGADGPFKFREGKVLRHPGAIREAGIRVLRYYFAFFVPFYLDSEQADPKYVGLSTWSDQDFDGGEAKDVTCHKILVRSKGKQAKIKDNILALYLDTKTCDLKRMVYGTSPSASYTARIRIIDFKNRVDVEGVYLPAYMEVTEIKDGEFHAAHKINLSHYDPNTGLEGVGFEMTNQEQEKKKETKGKKTPKK